MHFSTNLSFTKQWFVVLLAHFWYGNGQEANAKASKFSSQNDLSIAEIYPVSRVFRYLELPVLTLDRK